MEEESGASIWSQNLKPDVLRTLLRSYEVRIWIWSQHMKSAYEVRIQVWIWSQHTKSASRSAYEVRIWGLHMRSESTRSDVLRCTAYTSSMPLLCSYEVWIRGQHPGLMCFGVLLTFWKNHYALHAAFHALLWHRRWSVPLSLLCSSVVPGLNTRSEYEVSIQVWIWNQHMKSES